MKHIKLFESWLNENHWISIFKDPSYAKITIDDVEKRYKLPNNKTENFWLISSKFPPQAGFKQMDVKELTEFLVHESKIYDKPILFFTDREIPYKTHFFSRQIALWREGELPSSIFDKYETFVIE